MYIYTLDGSFQCSSHVHMQDMYTEFDMLGCGYRYKSLIKNLHIIGIFEAHFIQLGGYYTGYVHDLHRTRIFQSALYKELRIQQNLHNVWHAQITTEIPSFSVVLLSVFKCFAPSPNKCRACSASTS